MYLINFVIVLLVVWLASCSVGPEYTPPSVEVPVMWKHSQSEVCEGFEANGAGELVYLDGWWQVFEEDKLEELENLALENNRNLWVAFERVQEARALMGIAAADFYPQITLNPLYSSTGELIKTFGGGNHAKRAANQLNSIFRVHELLYFLPINLSYELDLWGKIRDQYDAAKYTWLAQQKDYEGVMLALTSDLAAAYFQLRTADAELDLLASILKTRQKALEINKARYEEEIIFYADVTLAGEEVDNVLLQLNETQRIRNRLEDQIAVLIGVPASEFSLEHNPLRGLPPCIPEGIPSEVLLRRPDIAEAEYKMRSEHALVKQAYSLFFPSLTLTAAGGFESPILKDFLRWISRYWMVGGQSNQIAFDGFRTTSNLERQIAVFKEASGVYQQQILLAFQEVEDALTNIDSYAKQYAISLSTTALAQKTYELYDDRYKLGVIYYIDVANTENDLLTYQMTINTLQGYRFLSAIQLIKALGGGWQPK